MSGARYFLNLKSVGGESEKMSEIKVERDVKAYCQCHKHAFVEVVYFYQGAGTHFVDGEEFHIKKGDMFIINPNVYHEFFGKNLKEMNIMFNPNFVGEDPSNKYFLQSFFQNHFPAEIVQENKLKNYLYVSDSVKERYERTAMKMLREYNERRPCYLSIMKNELEMLLLQSLRNTIQKEDVKDRRYVHADVIERAMELIDENIREIKRVEDMTDKIGYNKLYFNRLFQEYTGVSIAQYIRLRKMEEAGRLLVNTNLTVEKICELLQYSDIKNFYTSFKRVMKVTPSEYRTQMLEMEEKYKIHYEDV